MDGRPGVFCVFVVGPTATGKTRFAIDLALALDGEVINADSMQVFRGFDLGTAKPTVEETRGVKHHMIDVADPAADDGWSVAVFAERAREAISSVSGAGRLPIVAGGSGLYINSLIYDMDFSGAGRDEGFRREIVEIPSKHSPEALYAILKSMDAEAALAIHPNNTKRVARAIERLRSGGEHGSVRGFPESFRPSASIVPFILRLTMERGALYERIDERARAFVGSGLIEEVRGLMGSGVSPGANAMQGIGYKEIAAFLKGDCDIETAVSLIQRNTRRFAKRQETWFKRLDADAVFDMTVPGGYGDSLEAAVEAVSAARSAAR